MMKRRPRGPTVNRGTPRLDAQPMAPCGRCQRQVTKESLQKIGYAGVCLRCYLELFYPDTWSEKPRTHDRER